jgi:hypothetical protein
VMRARQIGGILSRNLNEDPGSTSHGRTGIFRVLFWNAAPHLEQLP